MKLTKSKLKQMIKEELGGALGEEETGQSVFVVTAEYKRMIIGVYSGKEEAESVKSELKQQYDEWLKLSRKQYPNVWTKRKVPEPSGIEIMEIPLNKSIQLRLSSK